MLTDNFHLIKSQLFTVGDYIRYGASQFNKAELFFGHGTDNAWDEAKTLVMFALELPESYCVEVIDNRLIDEEKEEILTFFAQRVNEGLPAAYITHRAYFANLPFYVDERVLVPRSPIAELILKDFSPFLLYGEPKRILDLCTGSGCIAIACAYQFPYAEVDALDLSVDALNVAQINIDNHGLTEQVIPIQSDVFSGIEGQIYDLIVTNPPYVDQADMDLLPLEYRHEPEMGLASGVDGLDIVRKILAQSADYLNKNGLLVCEVGNSQIHVEALYPEVPFHWVTFEKGGHGVFVLTKAQLQQYAQVFIERSDSKNSKV